MRVWYRRGIRNVVREEGVWGVGGNEHKTKETASSSLYLCAKYIFIRQAEK